MPGCRRARRNDGPTVPERAYGLASLAVHIPPTRELREPFNVSQLRTVQVLGGGNAGSSAHVRLAGRGAGRAGRAGHRVRPRRAGSRLRLHRRRGRPRARAAQQRPGLRGRAAGGMRGRRPGARARAARLLPGRARAQRTAHPARRHLAHPGVRRGRRAPICCGCWSGGSSRPPPSCSAPRPTSSTGPGSRGARDARLAAVALPAPRGPASATTPTGCAKVRAELGATGRPLLMAVGSLDRHRGYDMLLDAARAWRRLDPVPLVVIAGEGPLRGELSAADRERGAARPARRPARRHRRTARRRRSRAAAQPLGVALRARPGGPPRARAARRDRRRRQSPNSSATRPNSSRTGTRRRSPRPSYGSSATRRGGSCSRDRGALARRPTWPTRGRDGRPSAQRLRRVDPARPLPARRQAPDAGLRSAATMPCGPAAPGSGPVPSAGRRGPCPATPRCAPGGCRASAG